MKKLFRFLYILLRKSGAISAVIALLITGLSYLRDCIPYPMFESLDRYAFIQRFIKIDTPLPKDVLLVNTSNDQELVNTIQGNASIADRGKLSSFLQIADSCREYKVILYDLLFESECISKNDSLLGALLSRLPNLIIVREVNNKGISSSLQFEDELNDKTAFNSYYYPFFSTGFTRYQLIQEGKPSAALKMYELLDNGTIQRHFIKSSPIITLSKNMCSVELDGSHTITNCNIGRDYLDSMSKDSLCQLIKNKIVIIGDFDNDVHDSYVGKIPGPFIALAAYDYLHSGKHRITLLKSLFLFLLYFLISLFVVNDTFINKFLHNKLLFLFITYGLVLFIVGSIFYIWRRIIISIIVPSIMFSVISKCHNIILLKKARNEK